MEAGIEANGDIAMAYLWRLPGYKEGLSLAGSYRSGSHEKQGQLNPVEPDAQRTKTTIEATARLCENAVIDHAQRAPTSNFEEHCSGVWPQSQAASTRICHFTLQAEAEVPQRVLRSTSRAFRRRCL